MGRRGEKQKQPRGLKNQNTLHGRLNQIDRKQQAKEKRRCTIGGAREAKKEAAVLSSLSTAQPAAVAPQPPEPQPT